MSQAADQTVKLWKGTLPVHGIFTAGLLTGWRYAFLQFIRVDDTIAMDVRATAPNWPFPKTVRFRLDKHHIRVKPISGARAKNLDANALIERCLVDGIAKSPFETI